MFWKEAFEKGIANFKSGKLSDALSCMNEAVELQNDDYRIYDSRAAVYERLGNLKAALLDSKKVIDLSPQHWQGYVRATRIFNSLDKHGSAIKMVDLGLSRLRSDDSRRREQLLELREQAVQAQAAAHRQRQLHLAKTAYHVGKLPIEILAEIFTILVDTDHCQVILLSHICNHWRRIIVATPSLWRTLVLSNKRPVRKIKIWLEHSKSRITTLTVHRALSPVEFPTVLAELKRLSWDFLQNLHAHGSFLVELHRLLSESSMVHFFTHLKRLSLDSCASVEHVFTPSREWNLIELSSTGPMQFPERCWQCFSQLRILHVRQFPAHFPLAAIEAIPLLESLVLDFSSPMAILGTVQQPLSMIYLTSIELRNVENPFALLGSITMPSLQDMAVFGAISRVDEALLHVLCDEHNSLVSLRVGNCGLHSRTLVTILSRTSHLETLQIYCVDGVVNEALQYLAGKDLFPELQSTFREGLPCSALKHVDVSRCSDLSTSSAYALVKSRLQNEPEASHSMPNHCKIESLRTDGCPKMDAELLQWFRSKVERFSCIYMTKKEARQR
ncbi:hypothetical protein V8B97DRAFT_1863874 [Scleroderma yunnanense]